MFDKHVSVNEKRYMADIHSILKTLRHIDFDQLAKSSAIRDNSIHFSTASDLTWRQAIELWLPHAAELIAGQPARPCPACGSEKGDPIYFSYDAHTFTACRVCGCWYVPYVVDTALFEKLFERSAEARDKARLMAEERLTLPSAQESDRSRFEELMALLALFGKSTVLDIGANAGQFVAVAREHGLQAFGLEADPFALQVATRLNRVVVPDVCKLPLQQFDLVTLWESLEHISNPPEILAFAQSRLAKGGLLVMTMPNLNNLQLQQMRGDCSYSHGGYNTPGHINFFGKDQLEIALNRAGLKTIFFDTMYSSSIPSQYAYLTSQSQGARQALFRRDKEGVFYPAVLNAIGPHLALLERMSDTAPILFCVACRAEEYAAHAPVAAQLNERKNRALEDTLERLEPFTGQTKLLFSIDDTRDLRLVVCAQNQFPENLRLAIKHAQLSCFNNFIPIDLASLSPLSDDVHTKKSSEVIFVEADSVRSNILLSLNLSTLTTGEYTLEIFGASTEGRAAVGLLDSKTDQWVLTPQKLPLSRSQDDFTTTFCLDSPVIHQTEE